MLRQPSTRPRPSRANAQDDGDPITNRPFSKMAVENLNKSKLKTNTSTGKSTLTLVTLPSFDISGEISAEKMQVENRKIYRLLYDWGYNAYPQSYKRLQIFQFSTYIFSADISLVMLKRGRVTKAKVLFLVLVFVFNSSSF